MTVQQQQHFVSLMSSAMPEGDAVDARRLTTFKLSRMLPTGEANALGADLDQRVSAGRAAAERAVAEEVAAAVAGAEAHYAKLKENRESFARRVADLSGFARQAEHRAAAAIKRGDDPTEHEQEVARHAAEKVVFEKRLAVIDPACSEAWEQFQRDRERATRAAKQTAHAAAAEAADKLAAEVWAYLADRLERINELRGWLNATGEQ